MDKPKKKTHPYLQSPLVAMLLTLLDARGIMAMDLADRISISSVALSNILTGKSWPRKKTFEKLLDALCLNQEEANRLRNTYETFTQHKGLKIPTGTGFDLDEIPQDKRAKVAHTKAKMKMAQRARQKTFRNALRAAIDHEAIPYEADYLVGDILIDFRIRFCLNEKLEAKVEGDAEGIFPIEREIALVCEYDPDATDEGLRAMSRFIQTSLLVDEAIVVVPHTEGTPYRCFSNKPNTVLSDSWVISHLKKLKEIEVPGPTDV